MQSVVRFASLASLALVFSSHTLAAQGEPAADLIRQARQLNNDGKQVEALAAFEQAIKLTPDLYDTHAGAGATLDLLGRYDEARKHLARAIDLASPEQKGNVLRSMATSYLFDRQGKKAIPFGKQAVDQQVAAGDYDAAGEIANELARILLESGDLDDAQSWYKMGYDYALKQSSLADSAKDLWEFRYENALARLAARRAQSADAQKHVAAAKAAFDRGRIPGQAPFVSYLTGYVAFFLKDYPTAIADLQRGNTGDPLILALLAQAYEQTGEPAKAMDSWKQILAINTHIPTNAYARPLAMRKVK
jgi:tetratricopeptide (TPR) repeat protein